MFEMNSVYIPLMNVDENNHPNAANICQVNAM